jgi:hypothetical protein
MRCHSPTRMISPGQCATLLTLRLALNVHRHGKLPATDKPGRPREALGIHVVGDDVLDRLQIAQLSRCPSSGNTPTAVGGQPRTDRQRVKCNHHVLSIAEEVGVPETPTSCRSPAPQGSRHGDPPRVERAPGTRNLSEHRNYPSSAESRRVLIAPDWCRGNSRRAHRGTLNNETSLTEIARFAG